MKSFRSFQSGFLYSHRSTDRHSSPSRWEVIVQLIGLDRLVGFLVSPLVSCPEPEVT